jgi:hypothetical protein
VVPDVVDEIDEATSATDTIEETGVLEQDAVDVLEQDAVDVTESEGSNVPKTEGFNVPMEDSAGAEVVPIPEVKSNQEDSIDAEVKVDGAVEKKFAVDDAVPVDETTIFGESELSRKVACLVLWQCPRTSGGVFALVNLLWYLTQSRGYSAVTLVSYGSILLALSNLAFIKIVHPLVTFFNFADKNADPKTMVVGSGDSFLDAEFVGDVVKQAVLSVNDFYLRFVSKVLLWKDMKLSLMTLGALNFASLIGRVFTLPGTLYTLFILAFSIPKAYLSKKKEVDAVLVVAEKHVQDAYEQGSKKAEEVLGPIVEKVKPYLKNVPGFAPATSEAKKVQ